MNGSKLMNIAIIILGISLIVLGMGMAYSNANASPSTNLDDTKVNPYKESGYIEVID